MEASLSKQLALADLITNFTQNTLRVGRGNIKTGYLRVRKELLNRYWTEFEQNYEGLRNAEALTEHVYITDNRYSMIEMNYSRVLGHLYDEELPGQLAPSPVTITPTGQLQRQVHLLKITLPAFSGLQEEWESFRDLFRSLVHIDPGLSRVQKLHYLISCVKGSAQDALHGLENTEANYTVD